MDAVDAARQLGADPGRAKAVACRIEKAETSIFQPSFTPTVNIKENDVMADPSSGTISFIEIGSADAGAVRSFFSAVFGWSSHDDAWLQTPSVKAGTHGDDPAPQIYVYFQASDLEAAAEKVRAAGGEAADVTDEPGFGRFVNCRGPGGFHFGLHQPG